MKNPVACVVVVWFEGICIDVRAALSPRAGMARAKQVAKMYSDLRMEVKINVDWFEAEAHSGHFHRDPQKTSMLMSRFLMRRLAPC